jgi:hypothetical protein
MRWTSSLTSSRGCSDPSSRQPHTTTEASTMNRKNCADGRAGSRNRCLVGAGRYCGVAHRRSICRWRCTRNAGPRDPAGAGQGTHRQRLQRRHFCQAGFAPTGPQGDQHHLAAQIGQAPGLTVKVGGDHHGGRLRRQAGPIIAIASLLSGGSSAVIVRPQPMSDSAAFRTGRANQRVSTLYAIGALAYIGGEGE